MYSHSIKRLLDILLASLALVILSPVLLLISLAVLLDAGRPVIFRQTRLGLHGEVFTLLKFRTMAVDSEHTGSGVYSSRHDSRVTRSGRILRATSLDELPQLINILRGDMSLIGPRPPLTYHPWPLEEYTPEQLRMFDVRPGMTGWAQVNGRREVEWKERIRMSVWYAEHCSFWLDVRIFLMSIVRVISNQGNENIGESVKREERTSGEKNN